MGTDFIDTLYIIAIDKIIEITQLYYTYELLIITNIFCVNVT